MSESWNRRIREELARLREERLERILITTEEAAWPVLLRGGKRLLNFSSNNYLGLANHPLLLEAMSRAAVRGAGATASRLIIGHNEETERLEEEIARFKGTEAALVFSSGYMANLGLLSALLGSRDAVFSDQYNHASIVDGIRLSGAHHFRYRHRNVEHLEKLLRKADELGIRNKLIVTDSVFSMDGDVAPLKELVELKKRYDAALVVDEAHGSGVFGPHGEGMLHQLGLTDEVDLVMGTFSKAFGVYGAYVAGKRNWIRYLVNKCRSLIYTTALPPVIIGAIRTALTLVQKSDERRKQLHAHSERFRRCLQEAGFDLAGSTTQIVPLVVGESERALAFSRKLEERGILAVAIRPPTVPMGAARLRFSLIASHEKRDVETVLEAIMEVGTELGVIAS
jgi:8-amino-7-oxononanoate synthase